MFPTPASSRRRKPGNTSRSVLPFHELNWFSAKIHLCSGSRRKGASSAAERLRRNSRQCAAWNQIRRPSALTESEASEKRKQEQESEPISWQVGRKNASSQAPRSGYLF